MTQNNYTSTDNELLKAEKEMENLRNRIVELRKQRKHKLTKDYTLKNLDGTPVKLSSLFGEKDDLILVHNMGKRCPYCTLWADGFNGIFKHIESRASFALVSHDDPLTAKKFQRVETGDLWFCPMMEVNSQEIWGLKMMMENHIQVSRRSIEARVENFTG